MINCEVTVQKRVSADGKAVYRVKRPGTKKCLWTDDPKKIDDLKAAVAFDTIGGVSREC